MTRPAQLIFAALAIASLCAIVISQRVKDAPALVRRVTVTPLFTPNGDGYRDVVKIRFALGRPDDLTVTVVDAGGTTVRRLAVARSVPADRTLRLQWDGRTDRGMPAAEGVYRVRLTLRRRDRTLELQRSARLRVRAPHGRGARRGG